jgi:hypothetical protein
MPAELEALAGGLSAGQIVGVDVADLDSLLWPLLLGETGDLLSVSNGGTSLPKRPLCASSRPPILRARPR